MDGPSQGRLKNLCAVFKIPLSDCAASPEAALALLSHLYAMPLIKNKNDRHNYGNQILANTQGHFASNSNFVGRLGTHVIMMQELPAWYQNLNKSTDVLVEQYLDIERTVNFLNKVGYGSAGGAAAAGAAEMIKKGTVKEAAKKNCRKARRKRRNSGGNCRAHRTESCERSTVGWRYYHRRRKSRLSWRSRANGGNKKHFEGPFPKRGHDKRAI